MDSVMRFFLLSGLVVGVTILALPHSVNGQPPNSCEPSCRPNSLVPVKATREDADAALRLYPAVQERLEKLEASDQSEAGETGIGSRREKRAASADMVSAPCKCPRKCRVKREQLRVCNGCIIFWPFNGVTDVTCGGQTRCYLGCDCRGRCTLLGPRLQWVVLYCPQRLPENPFVFRRITLCSNCCCHNVNWWWQHG